MKIKRQIYIAVLLLTIPGIAQWVPNANINTPVCQASFDQSAPKIATDEAGNSFIVWFDTRNGSDDRDIYAQALNSAGVALWQQDGVPICTASGDQQSPNIISDGEGGALIVWYDHRDGDFDVYVQRIGLDGNVLWQENGVAICTAPGHQEDVRITGDGVTGAILTWEDARSGNDFDIYAQQIDGAGITRWQADGKPVCVAPGDQQIPFNTADGFGGIITTWYDQRGGDFDIYAQRLSPTGDPLWDIDGLPIAVASGDQERPRVVRSGSGASIFAWEDDRVGDGGDIFAQRVADDGAILWDINGVAICQAPERQEWTVLTEDQSGGAIIAWWDHRNQANENPSDIFSQRIDSLGTVQWVADGVPVCIAGDVQEFPEIISDDKGGAIISWHDSRSSVAIDVYGQRVLPDGTFAWPLNGQAVSTAADRQSKPKLSADGLGGAVFIWRDQRTLDLDIFAQRVTAEGILPDHPAASTNGVSELLDTTVVLQGVVNANGLTTGYSFQWSRQSNFDVNNSGQETVPNSGDTEVSARIDGLLPNTTYFFRLVAGNVIDTVFSDTASFTTRIEYPDSFFATASFGFENLPQADDYSAADYRLIGFPGNQDVSLASLMSGTAGVDWQAYRDTGGDGDSPEDYLAAYNTSSSFNLTTGRAWWIIHRGDLVIEKAQVASAPLNEDDNAVHIPLNPGWNMITNPLIVSVPWDTVLTLNNIESVIYEFVNADSSWRFASEMEPFTGYYFDNSSNQPLTELLIPLPLPEGLSAPLSNKVGSEANWQLTMSLQRGGIRDSSLAFGAMDGARHSRDAFDIRKPRGLTRHDYLYFYHPEWEGTTNRYGVDIRPLVQGAETWDFRMSSAPGVPHILRLNNLSRLPANLEIYLVSSILDEPQNLRLNPDIHLSPRDELTLFSVVVGKAGFIEAALEQAIPGEFRLGQNYPNPFNPETTIPVSIREPVDASITLYSVLGSRVATIFDGRLQAGIHLLTWDGRNNAGRQVASGIYFYQLAIPSQNLVQSQKFVLLR